ncbi:AAA family ATPase [Variovorax boronicumulans]|uniref:AAA family ATPase n=1 Tax=Variovorax boronicumulans TaxID=436515 RepID=UPI00214CE300
MAISRRALFGKLNLTLFRALESATAFAKLRGNPYVELIHWLHQLWQLSDSDLHRILRHYQVDPQVVEKDLAVALSALPAGATSLSDFSHHIGSTIERAWLLSSLEFGGRSIRSGWLLVALVQTPELRGVLIGASAAFQKIPVDALNESIMAIVGGSPEDKEGAHDGSGLTAAVPGESSGALADVQDGKSALSKYCSDLTARARAGEIDPVIGRENEIRTMVDILLRRRQNNPLLTGEAGVGKTAVVEGLALAIARAEVPPILREVRLLSLDVGALLAGASMRGEFESRLKALLEEAGQSVQPVILFVDEVHTLIGAGGQAGTGDAANLLKPALARGTLRTVGATTWSEYKRHIEKDPALTRRFQVLQVPEPEEVSAIEMVRGLVSTFTQHHGVTVLDEAVRAAVTLSHRYIPSRQLPDKAISLLDTACARVAMSLHTPPATVEHLRQRIAALDTELSLLAQEGVIAHGSGARAPMAPTKNGRTDSMFGSIYVYLPAGTPTRTTAPTSHLQGQRGTGGGGASAASDHFPPNTLHAAQWVEIRYERGSAHVSSYRATADTTSLVDVGYPIGSPNFETDFEYTLYTKAVERHNSLDAATQAASSPSGWYELLRFGRNLGADPLPTNAAHWREIPTATGTIWADLNAPGTFKFSDADFLPVRGWNCFNDDATPNDQRCDSLHLRGLIRDPDPQNERRMEPAQLARRLGEATVREKLRRAICQFPSEWDQTNIEARYGWLETEDYKDTDDDATGAQKWNRFVKHAKAISFLDLPGDFLKADWRFHPREFVGHFRQCFWLSEKEAIQLFPKTALRNAGAKGWVSEGVNPGKQILKDNLTYLNKTTRKYCITTPSRLAAFYGNAMQETQRFALLAETGGASTRYAPWFGRGFLQLTWPENYIQYAKFKGISVSTQLEAQFVAAHRIVQSTGVSTAFMALERQTSSELIKLRDAVETLGEGGFEASDSAGAYWAWSAAGRSADPTAAFMRATAGGVTYYTHGSFGDVAATVNVGHPSSSYALIYGVQARFQAHVAATMTLTDREQFPDAQGQMKDVPEGWVRRLL